MVVVAPLIRRLSARAFRVLIAGLGRLVPRSLRYRYARLFARLFRPLIAYQLRSIPGLASLNSELELSLGYVMRAMTEYGCQFDLPARIHGADAIPSGGVLFTTGHLFLAIAGVRFLCDQGRKVFLVRLTPEHRLIGTRIPMPVIVPGNLLFVRMRNALRGGTSVAIMLDDALASELVIRRQAIEVAVRSGIPIVFFGANLGNDGAIDVVFERPRASDGEAIARELIDFIQRF